MIAASIDEGLALIEDFGAETVIVNGAPSPARYAEAVALLVDLHGRDLPDSLPAGGELYRLPTYDIEAMLVEVELALDWYAPAVARVVAPSGARMQFLGIWRDAARADPRPSGRPGRCATSIRRTCIGWPRGRVSPGSASSTFRTRCSGRRPTISRRCCRTRASTCPTISKCGSRRFMSGAAPRPIPASTPSAFAVAYAAMGAQRATKILGLFARLDKRDGKPQYLGHLPRIERYLAKNLAHPLLRPLAVWYQNHLSRALGKPPEGLPPPGLRID